MSFNGSGIKGVLYFALVLNTIMLLYLCYLLYDFFKSVISVDIYLEDLIGLLILTSYFAFYSVLWKKMLLGLIHVSASFSEAMDDFLIKDEVFEKSLQIGRIRFFTIVHFLTFALFISLFWILGNGFYFSLISYQSGFIITMLLLSMALFTIELKIKK